ncbi:MAG: D-tyrosyl-tRNA(Tyr) deacylase [Clostridia bacterium]|nr:D-tyrosyl-tRNA(Tyr) deacylase [Clostridia bacterium]
MKAVIQRVKHSSVSVGGKVIGEIGRGFNVLLGICEDDTPDDALVLAGKVARLRIFEDENEKMNLSLTDVDGEALVISQFTLCADTKKGNRPSFTFAARPEKAVPIYEFFMQELLANGVKKVEHGEFGADMAVEILNDGPVTIILDSETWRKS